MRRPRTRKIASAFLVLVVAAIAVVWVLRGPGIGDLGVRTQSDAPIGPGEPGWSDTVQVRSLGVAGWLVRRGDDAFLTGPLYSFPMPQRLLGFGGVEPSRAAFDAHHPKDAPGVRAVLAAHAHYDHALYVPLALKAHADATAYGSSTLRHLLAGYGLADRAVALDGKVDSRNGAPPGDGCNPLPSQTGEWEYVPGSRMRIRAIAHHHAAQVLGVWHLWPGCLEADLTAPPTRASQWLEGPIFAYLVDFLAEDGVTPVWRVYYQDSPVDGTSGTVPDEILAERPVDLAFLGVGNYDRTVKPEAAIANLRPSHVILHHWENFFFGDPRKSLRQLPLHDGAAYKRILQAELDRLGGPRTLTITAPDVLLRFDPPSRSP